jgi:zinc protease
MRKTIISLVCLIIIAGALFIICKNTSKTVHHPLTMKPSSMTDAPLTLQEITTSEGYSVWLAPSEIPVVSVGIAFLGAGHRNATNNLGLVNLLTSLLDEGAGPYSSQAFKRMLLEKNIQLSISANQDNIIISFRTVKENVKDAFELVHLMLTSPRFEDEDVKRVKQQVSSAMEQSLHHPRPVAQEGLQRFMLGADHPYNPKIAECAKNIPLIQVQQLRDYMRQHLTKSSVRVAVAGDITSTELSDLIDSTFKDLSALKKEDNLQKSPYKNLGKTLELQMDIPQTFVYFAQPTISVHHPDFYALFIVNSILSNAFESRLWHEVREKRGLAYFCATGVTNSVLSDVLLGMTATKTESVNQTIQIIKEEWKKLSDHGVTAEELEFHKKNAIGSYALNFSSTTDIVTVLLSYQQRGLSIKDINSRNHNIQKLTLEDVNRVAREQLKENELIFVKVGRQQVNVGK